MPPIPRMPRSRQGGPPHLGQLLGLSQLYCRWYRWYRPQVICSPPPSPDIQVKVEPPKLVQDEVADGVRPLYIIGVAAVGGQEK